MQGEIRHTAPTAPLWDQSSLPALFLRTPSEQVEESRQSLLQLINYQLSASDALQQLLQMSIGTRRAPKQLLWQIAKCQTLSVEYQESLLWRFEFLAQRLGSAWQRFAQDSNCNETVALLRANIAQTKRKHAALSAVTQLFGTLEDETSILQYVAKEVGSSKTNELVQTVTSLGHDALPIANSCAELYNHIERLVAPLEFIAKHHAHHTIAEKSEASNDERCINKPRFTSKHAIDLLKIIAELEIHIEAKKDFKSSKDLLAQFRALKESIVELIYSRIDGEQHCNGSSNGMSATERLIKCFDSIARLKEATILSCGFAGSLSKLCVKFEKEMGIFDKICGSTKLQSASLLGELDLKHVWTIENVERSVEDVKSSLERLNTWNVEMYERYGRFHNEFECREFSGIEDQTQIKSFVSQIFSLIDFIFTIQRDNIDLEWSQYLREKLGRLKLKDCVSNQLRFMELLARNCFKLDSRLDLNVAFEDIIKSMDIFRENMRHFIESNLTHANYSKMIFLRIKQSFDIVDGGDEQPTNYFGKPKQQSFCAAYGSTKMCIAELGARVKRLRKACHSSSTNHKASILKLIPHFNSFLTIFDSIGSDLKLYDRLDDDNNNKSYDEIATIGNNSFSSRLEAILNAMRDIAETMCPTSNNQLVVDGRILDMQFMNLNSRIYALARLYSAAINGGHHSQLSCSKNESASLRTDGTTLLCMSCAALDCGASGCISKQTRCSLSSELIDCSAACEPNIIASTSKLEEDIKYLKATLKYLRVAHRKAGPEKLYRVKNGKAFVKELRQIRHAYDITLGWLKNCSKISSRALVARKWLSEYAKVLDSLNMRLSYAALNVIETAERISEDFSEFNDDNDQKEIIIVSAEKLATLFWQQKRFITEVEAQLLKSDDETIDTEALSKWMEIDRKTSLILRSISKIHKSEMKDFQSNRILTITDQVDLLNCLKKLANTRIMASVSPANSTTDLFANNSSNQLNQESFRKFQQLSLIINSRMAAIRDHIQNHLVMDNTLFPDLCQAVFEAMNICLSASFADYSEVYRSIILALLDDLQRLTVILIGEGLNSDQSEQIESIDATTHSSEQKFNCSAGCGQELFKGSTLIYGAIDNWNKVCETFDKYWQSKYSRLRFEDLRNVECDDHKVQTIRSEIASDDDDLQSEILEANISGIIDRINKFRNMIEESSGRDGDKDPKPKNLSKNSLETLNDFLLRAQRYLDGLRMFQVKILGDKELATGQESFRSATLRIKETIEKMLDILINIFLDQRQATGDRSIKYLKLQELAVELRENIVMSLRLFGDYKRNLPQDCHIITKLSVSMVGSVNRFKDQGLF